MSEPQPPPSPTPQGGLRAFFVDEMRAHMRAWWRATWTTQKWLTALCWLWFVWLLFGPGSPSHSALDGVLTALIAVGFAAYVALFVAVPVGLFALAWRLFGVATLFLMLSVPVVFALVFYLGGPLLGELAGEVGDALVASANAKGFPQAELAATELLTGSMPLARAGVIALPFILFILVYYLLLALPALLADLAAIGFDANVALASAAFVGALAGMVVAASVVATLLSVPPLLIGFVRRLRRRYRDYMGRTSASQRAPGRPAPPAS